ncbi:hypothetical protein INT45_013151 [Circinella minor]|uniref:Uncharacterized protein n=1 Tax=Circinella minor TaxID=1195481 RepID=A0A8H7R9H8_9FUNG|nr:hypothetical protein INT45_013151 [Circinella minor]
MATECNPDICEQDAALSQANQDDQRTLQSLSQYSFQYSLIRECLKLNNANDIPLHVWTRTLDGDNTINQQRFHRLVQHIITWFSSRCERVTPYFHDQIQYLQFQWCEVYIRSRSTELVDMETWTKDKGGYADGIGYTGQDERLLMEVSSGGLEEDLDHTLNDSLKLLENLAAILNTYRAKYLNSNKTTFSKLKVFGIQCIKPTITLVSVSASGDGKYLYQTPRTSQIPITFDERHHLLSLFELLAYLLDVCQEQSEVVAQLQKEHTGYVEVPRDKLLKSVTLQELP